MTHVKTLLINLFDGFGMRLCITREEYIVNTRAKRCVFVSLTAKFSGAYFFLSRGDA
jgi:hypothetical protein